MLTNMGDWRRTHNCAELTKNDVSKDIILMGWVQRRRDHGGVIFVDLRDRAGITQVVFDESAPEAQKIADAIRTEYVIAVKGKVTHRPDNMVNKNIVTGEIEIVSSEVKILNKALTPPFVLDEYDNTSEEVRLKYRYLDLRRVGLQKNIILRHNLVRSIREYLYGKGFLDIETPFLTKSTPEGARDYLVPSRVNPGKFYALPQSPQMFKQLLMIGGLDKYFQIVKCFRDEDLRSDRQPEFTQLDIEMSFVGRDDVMNLIEELFVKVFKDIKGIDMPRPFPTMDYDEAMEKYGHDAPDTRFEMHLKTLNHIVRDCDFKVFADAAKKGSVKAINAKGGGSKFSRKDIDNLTELVTTLGAKGLAYIKINADGYQSPIIKFIGDEVAGQIVKEMDGEVGDIIFFGAGDTAIVNLSLHRLRLKMAQMLDIIEPNKFSLTWILNFPLLEWDSDEKRFVAVHHPFTSPLNDDIKALEADPKGAKANAYDLVLNGMEIGGGSIRIYRNDVQTKMFELMGFTHEQIEAQFGFFTDALKYGTPPHGGIAFGIDRIAAIFTNSDSIRDVIAFPKNQRAVDMMSDAPSIVDDKQLKELHVKTDIIDIEKSDT